MEKYETVIGLEVHVQLLTESKIFCNCSTKFGLPPNTSACPVCLGLPGVLPVLNEKAFLYAIKTALALNCEIQDIIKFDRKNYYYPDLPKNFQISQYDKPLAYNGYLEIEQNGARKKIRIRRVHLEEDAGKLVHHPEKGLSYVDFNRTGIPLLEIVSEPEIHSPEEASAYLQTLKSILKYLGVSDCNMEEGSLRCDANISLRLKGKTRLGVKIELKNMNSFKAIRDALSYEAKRQIGLLQKGEEIAQETRLWDELKGMTGIMRTKEEAHDYRYFPEPDLVPFTIHREEIERIRRSLPELPHAKKNRFVSCYGLSEYDARVLTRDMEISNFFEDTTQLTKRPKEIANWLLGDVASILNEKKFTIDKALFKPAHLAELLELIHSEEISGKIAKEILPEVFQTGSSPKEIVRLKGLRQIKDDRELTSIIDKVLEENAKSADDYKKGQKNAIMYLVGQVMRATKGKANPHKVNEILKVKLGGNKGMTRIKFLFLKITVLFFLILCGSIYLRCTGEDIKNQDEELYNQIELFSNAVTIVQSDYIDEVKPKKLVYGALEGMLASLDGYSQFMDPESFKEMEIDTKGEFGGLGIEIGIRDGILTVIAPLDGTPAEKAGLKAGDRIVKIDGELTRDMKLIDAVKKLRGKPETEVGLTIFREDEERLLDFTIKRGIIKVKSIKIAKMLDEKIGYVKLAEFQENTPVELEQRLSKLKEGGMKAMILDLRNNPGGLLDAAYEVADKFLEKDKVVVSLKSRIPKQNKIYRARGKRKFLDFPIVVLVNEGSASASEIVAGAIQDNQRGIILGSNTFGKGSVQTVIPLKDGSAVKITTAAYYTPNDRLIRDKGIAPDVVVKLREVAKKPEEKKDIFEKLEEEKDKVKERKELFDDNQLQAAWDMLKGILIYKGQKD